MYKKIITSFFDKKAKLYFYGASAYISIGKALLHNKDGHILLAECSLVDQLLEQQIPSELLRPLSSRGFVGNSEFSSFPCDDKCEVKPEFFMVDLTNKCNMRCKYCLRNVSSLDKSVSEEKLHEICKYIEAYCDAENLSHVSIQPWGGEPLLELDLILKMRQWIHPKRTKVHFSIETNGLLLESEVIDTLYKNQIGLGVSIDGTSKTHNLQRLLISGKDTHDIVSQNLKIALERYGERLGTITTITRNNAEYIEEILDYFAKELKLTKVKFNFVHRSKFICCEELCLSKEEISKIEMRILHKIINLRIEGYPILEYNINVKLNNLLFLKYSDICLSKGCNGGRKMIVFDMEGCIYPCELTDTPEESIGNIDEDKNLIKIVKEAINQRTYFIPKKAEECNKCDWYAYCKGGCTVRAMSTGKLPPAVDEVECAIDSVLYPELIRLILEEPDKINILLGNQGILETKSNNPKRCI